MDAELCRTGGFFALLPSVTPFIASAPILLVLIPVPGEPDELNEASMTFLPRHAPGQSANKAIVQPFGLLLGVR